ncbi:hypothetical protein Elgi_46320 [Paenibacillus elgii]|uniref:hypothetical protein n=1 Tax=Paenibacillus elgii TaxID=189691 RepID=UPI002D7A7A03|nr:hypothetical protein Elgi_46320 [Paenibacillus elgii]
MNKSNFLGKKTSKLLAGSLSAVFLLGGSASGFPAVQAETANFTVDARNSVYTATYSELAPEPAPPQPGLLSPSANPPLMPPGPGHAELERAALLETLGMSSSELWQAQRAGQSLAEIAASRGVDVQKIVDLAAQSLTARLDRELADGRITQVQYNSRLNEVAERAASTVKRTPPQPPVPGELEPDFGPGLKHVDKDALLSTLGLSSDELRNLLKNGQSLADVAASKSVDVQKVIDLVARTLNSRLDQELSEKLIWRDEYETRKQEVAIRAVDAVQHKHPHPPGHP